MGYPPAMQLRPLPQPRYPTLDGRPHDGAVGGGFTKQNQRIPEHYSM